MDTVIIIFLIVALAFVVVYYEKRKPQSEEKEIIAKEEDKYPYEKTYLLTKNEWRFYKNLKPIADALGYSVIAKIRLADLIKVEAGTDKSEYARYFSKIKSKHIDFILCNPDNLAPVLLIELDDRSHNAAKRMERDVFVDNAVRAAGYMILHTYGGAELKEEIKKCLEQ